VDAETKKHLADLEKQAKGLQECAASAKEAGEKGDLHGMYGHLYLATAHVNAITAINALLGKK